jgi:hypothetical protein
MFILSMSLISKAFAPDSIVGRECVEERQTCSIEGRPIEVKVRSPLARVVSGENEADEADRQSHRKDGERVTGLQRK